MGFPFKTLYFLWMGLGETTEIITLFIFKLLLMQNTTFCNKNVTIFYLVIANDERVHALQCKHNIKGRRDLN